MGSAESCVDLHAYLGAGYVWSQAWGIDQTGNIVGIAQDPAGNRHAIMWTPVPEPATLSLLVLGGLLLARRHRAARVLPALLAGCLLLGSAGLASADVLNMGGTRNPATGQWTGLASVEFVTVGDPGNQPDTRVMMTNGSTGYGAVNYTYQIGKYDVTAGQYCQFLNAVAKTDPYRLYGIWMAPGFNLPSGTFGITQSGNGGNYTYNVIGDQNLPMNYVTWSSAARFCNWLSNGQPTGTQGLGTTETGSYTLNGATSIDALNAIRRNPGAPYVIPTENEWYDESHYFGFRIAMVPEPTTMAVMAAGGLLLARRRRG